MNIAPSPATTFAPHTTVVLLCCPACGSERHLRDAEGLPRGVARLIAPCPDCEGHGADASLLVFNDGRIERAQAAYDCPATPDRFDLPAAQHALPLHGAWCDRQRMHSGESNARG